MRLRYLKQVSVTELRLATNRALERYAKSDPWLDDFFDRHDYTAESRFEVDELPSLLPPTANGELYEIENTIALHRALNGLTPSQAADERLWAWLAHGPYWSYMVRRWPAATARKASRYILEHYFLADARSLVRHGIARLWWFGHATVDSKAAGPYHLTRLLLKTSDARQSIMERQFWRNRRVLEAMLERVIFWADRLDFYSPRERFRRLCKILNLYGGTILLDVLSVEQLHEIVDQIATTELNGKVGAQF